LILPKSNLFFPNFTQIKPNLPKSKQFCPNKILLGDALHLQLFCIGIQLYIGLGSNGKLRPPNYILKCWFHLLSDDLLAILSIVWLFKANFTQNFDFRIVCITANATGPDSKGGVITVNTNYNATATSTDVFEFKVSLCIF